ncbi:outer membrane protein, multidrug efflux system [Roseomonas rosea]|uniref:Outer membrane protein, multidrug efflux system n=1 Tax=Muricoccus roseus TaxID=198092 RepID=A0A1M6PG44_9PROT|nr:efflux transporter outer membrane subunit [Roseomonas rosea]SHK06862.1 outer membrane protein, multidrug efflux system [Roseomonas rosea]
MARPLPLLALGAALLAGCSLDPGYERPGAPVPAQWPQGAAYGAPQSGESTADSIGWESFFLDPGLRRLVGLALENNRDLRVAALNVEAAEAQYRVERGDLFPYLGASGAADYLGTPVTGSDGRTRSVTSRSFSLGAGFTAWEIDLFGRIRSLSRAALEAAFAQAETRRATQISLVAQVADAYLALLASRELLALTRQTLESQEASYRLTQATAAGGTTTALALRQAQTSVEAARANLALYTRQVAQAENALALLLGQPVPADLPASTTLASPLVTADLPAGLSSTVLLRRPDVLAAEYRLLSANANIGAARAAFFPTVSITASGGTAGTALSRLFQAGSGSWAFSPQISVPIFTGGINEATLDYTKLQKRVEIANYEKAIQTAFREVADALAARGTYGSQVEAQRRLAEAYADSYRLAELRFRSGVDSYLTVLDSQRSLYGAQQALITLRQEQLSSLVTLYKVLGGGWQPVAPAPRS